jgi:cytosine/adenosine deaminase-related metal-dependent hydrolase
MPPSEDRGAGKAALDALDTVIAGQPRRSDHEFTEATKHLARFRDALIAQHRAAGDEESHEIRARLGKVNAVISAVLAGHFPVGTIPWPEIETARALFAEVVAGA